MSSAVKPIPDSGTAGVACEDYKVEKFKKEFEKTNFEFSVHPFKTGIVVIKVKYKTPEELHQINLICKLVQDSYR